MLSERTIGGERGLRRREAKVEGQGDEGWASRGKAAARFPVRKLFLAPLGATRSERVNAMQRRKAGVGRVCVRESSFVSSRSFLLLLQLLLAEDLPDVGFPDQDELPQQRNERREYGGRGKVGWEDGGRAGVICKRLR